MKQRKRCRLLCLLFSFPLLFSCYGEEKSSQTSADSSIGSSLDQSSDSQSQEEPVDSSYTFFKKESLANRTVYVLDALSLSDDERLFAMSLQGLLLQKGVGCYLDNGRDPVFDEVSALYDLSRLGSFDDFAKLAISLLGVTNYVPLSSSFPLSASFASFCQEPLVPKSLDGFAKEIGLAENNIGQSWETLYEVSDTPRLIIEDSKSSAYLDFGIAQKALFLIDKTAYQGKAPYVCSLGDRADLGLAMDIEQKENLSFYGALSKGEMPQEEQLLETGKHYVSIVCEDGLSTSLLKESHAVSPLMQSEFSLFYSNEYAGGDPFLNEVTKGSLSLASGYSVLLNEAMAQSLSRFAYLKGKAINSRDVYAYMGSLDGGIVDSDDGTLQFINQKPFLSFAGCLDENNAYSLACAINQSSTDEKDPSAYSLIRVKSGTNLQMLKKFYSALTPEVQIVSVSTLLSAIREKTNHQNAVHLLPTNASTDYIGPEYSLYDMFSLKYAPASYVSAFAFGNGYGGFSATNYQSNNSITNQDGCLVMEDHGQSSSITNSLSVKLHVPSKASFLNFQIRSPKGSSFRVRAYDPAADQWRVIETGHYSNLCFQTISVDLSGIYQNKPQILGLVFEQMGAVGTDQVVYLDNVDLSGESERDPAFADDATALSQGDNLSLASDEWHQSGQIAFDSSGIQLMSSVENSNSRAQSAVWKKIAVGSCSGHYARIQCFYDTDTSAQFRVRSIDQVNYINEIVLPWTTLSGTGTLNLDLSGKENTVILLYLEFNRLSGQSSSLRIKNISFSYEEGHCLYRTNTTDSFSGSSSEWNLCGWKRDGDSLYGDLTADGGYGSLWMDGSNNGRFEPNLALCSWSKWYSLASASQEKLQFYARSGGPNDATYLRVRVEDAIGNSTLVSSKENSGWVVVSGEAWRLFEYDLTSFSGTDIRIVFEQTDHGVGVGEICFIDSVALLEALL